jgi:hypothetical protein
VIPFSFVDRYWCFGGTSCFIIYHTFESICQTTRRHILDVRRCENLKSQTDKIFSLQIHWRSRVTRSVQQRATGWKAEGRGFDSPQNQEILASRPGLEPIQPLIYWVPEDLPRGWSWPLCLLLRSRILEYISPLLHTPSWCGAKVNWAPEQLSFSL